MLQPIAAVVKLLGQTLRYKPCVSSSTTTLPAVEHLELRRLMSVSPADAPIGTLPTTTTLADTAPIISIGGSEVFTSRVAAVAPGGPAPTGTVTFFSYNGTYPTQIEPVLSDGTAAMPQFGTIPGYMAFIAFYSGDANYAASNSPAVFSAVNASPVVPTITNNTLPSSILTNASVKGVVTVTLSNPTPNTLSGVQGINVFALQYQGGQSFSSNVVGSLTKNVVLSPGSSRSFPIKVNAMAADGAPGSYALVATATNASVLSSFSETAGAGINTFFTVSAANVGLTATTTSLKPGAFGAKAVPFSFTVTVTDTGNVDASGTLTITSENYNDASPIGSLPTTDYHFPAHVKVGKSQRFVVHGRYLGEGTVPAGAYNLQLTIALDGATTHVSTSTPFTVS